MEDRGQLELFSQAKGSLQAKANVPRAFRFRISGYEKRILLAIAFAVTGIASFSLGVERGKRAAVLTAVPKPDLAVRTESLPLPVPEKAREVKEEKELREYTDSYTIQVASFSKRTNAEKEADTLKRRGMSPLVLSKGKFSIVCVGSFSKREEAETFLPKMKKQYQDCRIRRL